jgi:fatty acid desaturase
MVYMPILDENQKKEHMRSLSTINDPVFNSSINYSALDRFWLRFIRDERDLPFVYLTINITITLVPLAVLMYLPFITGWMWWLVAAVYFYFNNFVFKGPFGLMLHCTSHRPWFKKKYGIFNSYLPWFLGLFFGQTPETYASHHLGMHHRENNMDEDLSSTMHYQRDSLRDFMKYYLNFFLLGVIPLVKYFRRRNQHKIAFKVIRGEVFFVLLCVGLCFVNWPATMMAFILPLVISRLIMMMGNWAQHALVDVKDPGNHFKNSITCINTPYNKKCWNDGYHISHHIKPAMHWTKHPEHLQQNLDEYAANRALVFEGIEFLGVWIYLMRKKYEKLASHVVNINGMFASEDEVVSLLKNRTAKIV